MFSKRHEVCLVFVFACRCSFLPADWSQLRYIQLLQSIQLSLLDTKTEASLLKFPLCREGCTNQDVACDLDLIVLRVLLWRRGILITGYLLRSSPVSGEFGSKGNQPLRVRGSAAQSGGATTGQVQTLMRACVANWKSSK